MRLGPLPSTITFFFLLGILSLYNMGAGLETVLMIEELRKSKGVDEQQAGKIFFPNLSYIRVCLLPAQYLAPE